jgi:hypothetical protein
MVAAVLFAVDAKLFTAFPGVCEDCHIIISIRGKHDEEQVLWLND